MNNPEGITSEGKVAVIGLGISGLASLKNLLEQGFDAVGIERNDYIGGIWHFTEDKQKTSVLETLVIWSREAKFTTELTRVLIICPATIANSSKQFGCFTDFPFDVPDYPTAPNVSKNLQDYAERFDLLPHIRLGINITKIERSTDGQHWDIHLSEKDESRVKVDKYSKVLVCTGPWERSYKPVYAQEAEYMGKTLMGKEYKGPEEFRDKKVLIVGMANTACDIAVDLVGIAQEVHISHRSGTRIIPRMMDGKPTINAITRQLTGAMSLFERWLPSIGEWVGDRFATTKMLRNYPDIKPEWNLLPAPPFKNTLGVINDHIIDRLSDGSVKLVGGIESFYSLGVFTDGGKKTEVDTVIFCTGNYFDYSILSPEADPTRLGDSSEWDHMEHSNGLLYPRLYQTLFHPNFADSLAFLGPCRGFSFAVHSNADLASQAISQVWKGNYVLPGIAERNRWCEKNYRASLGVIKNWRTFRTGHFSAGEFERWLNDVAGTGVNEHLGWGWKEWKFWWSERELYGLIKRGVNTPFLYRLFEGRQGGRKKWEGAKREIWKANGRVPLEDR